METSLLNDALHAFRLGYGIHRFGQVGISGFVLRQEFPQYRHHHLFIYKEELLHGDKQGRKLDFLAQEMNREANTILSKANNLEVTNKGIELKTEIEKIREQIQNIE